MKIQLYLWIGLYFLSYILFIVIVACTFPVLAV